MADANGICGGDFCKFRCSSPVGPNPSTAVASYDVAAWQEILFQSGKGPKSIPYFGSENLLYNDFFENFLLKNLPCMFSPSITAQWLSRRLWSQQSQKVVENEGMDRDNRSVGVDAVDYEYLRRIYGQASVSVVNCKDVEYLEGYGSRDCRDMSFTNYLQYLKEDTLGDTCLYLKDWHIVRFHKNRCNGEETQNATDDLDRSLPYECPKYFQSDWLNEFCDDKDVDDYKFCYMGPSGSFTSFHADVYGSYSWSANVFGKKKWYLYPPGKEYRFYDVHLKKFNFSWDNPGVVGEDYVEVVQNAGECLFVPSGWHHVVCNLTEAVSINHNWFNGANICYIWSILQKALREVESELADLSDIPDFHQQCQLILKANHGMDYNSFFEILNHIQNKRSKSLYKKEDETGLVDDEANPHKALWHIQFDLNAIRHVVQEHCSKDVIVKKHFSERLNTFTQ